MKVKFKFTAAFLLASLLFGCSSTNNENQKGTTVNATNGHNELEFGTNVSKAEFEELAKNSEFTAEQLKAAANSLGYRCSLYKVTGSRIKKKLCSTRKQREVREEAAREILRNNRAPHISNTAASIDK